MAGFDPKPMRIGGPRQVGERVIFPPQGRLTLSTGVPVMTSTVSAQTVIRYTPYIGRMIPVWNGSRFEMIDIGGEITNDTTATAAGYAGPAAVTTDSNYDLFGWGRPGKGILTRGAVWNSATARSSGTENDLELFRGIYVNKNKIANGPPARCGTYLGTVRSNGSSQVDFIFGAAAAGGTAASFGVWNAYNRVRIATVVRNTNVSWTYGTVAWRAVEGSATMRVSFVSGLAEDALQTSYGCYIGAGTGAFLLCGVDLDSTTNAPLVAAGYGTTTGGSVTAVSTFVPQLGFHYLQAVEYNSVTTASTVYSDLGGSYIAGLTVALMG
jgi:hypothetical protein